MLGREFDTMTLEQNNNSRAGRAVTCKPLNGTLLSHSWATSSRGVCLRPTQGQASQPAKLGEVFARPCLLWRSYWKVRVHERRRIILTFAYLSVRVWQLVANGPGSAHTLVALIGLCRLLKQLIIRHELRRGPGWWVMEGTLQGV